MSGLQKGLLIPNSGDTEVKERLKNYLKKDKTGLRKATLNLFLSGGSFTTHEIFSHLESEYEVNYRGISAMVGSMNTKLGILSVDVSKKHNIYLLKDCHKEQLKSVLENY